MNKNFPSWSTEREREWKRKIKWTKVQKNVKLKKRKIKVLQYIWRSKSQKNSNLMKDKFTDSGSSPNSNKGKLKESQTYICHEQMTENQW